MSELRVSEWVSCNTRLSTRKRLSVCSSLSISSIVTFVLGGKLRGSLGKLPKFPVTFLLGMCLLTDGYHVHCGLWRRVCQNYPGTTFHGVLHPRWFGKKNKNSLILFIPNPLASILHAYDHTSSHRDTYPLLPLTTAGKSPHFKKPVENQSSIVVL